MRFIPLILLLFIQSFALTSDTVKVDNIVWHFDKEYTVGQFVNGDWWVAGDSVIINQITPEVRDSGENGWEVNPLGYTSTQGYSSALGDYLASLCPALPYKAKPKNDSIISIVKTIRSAVLDEGTLNCDQCISEMAVLTIVKTPITDINAFRPPFYGNYKPIHTYDNVDEGLLPSYSPPIANVPAISSFYKFGRLKAGNYKLNYLKNDLCADSSYPDEYGASIANENSSCLLRLMMNDDISVKRQLLIWYIQHGIDLAYIGVYNWSYINGAGHSPGVFLPAVFAATMLKNEDMRRRVKSTFDNFYEWRLLQWNHDSTKALWGDNQNFMGKTDSASAYEYWRNMYVYDSTGLHNGYKSYADPVKMIDGSFHPDNMTYQYIISKPLKGIVLSINMMDSLFKTWINNKVVNYVERWVDYGMLTNPDTCAACDGDWNNYGVTWGTVNKNTGGGCIHGSGRFISLDNKYADSGLNGNIFIDSLWNKYYESTYPNINTTKYSVPRGRVWIKNNTVVTDIGEPLRGGTFWLYGWMSSKIDWAKTMAPWDSIRNHGFNTVRLAVGYRPDHSGNLTIEQYDTILDSLINIAQSKGMYAVVDFHPEPGYYDSSQGSGVEFWTHFAPRYKNRTHVIYEICNEPVFDQPSSYNVTVRNDLSNMYKICSDSAPETHLIFMSFCQTGYSGLDMNSVADLMTNVDWTKTSVGFHSYWRDTVGRIERLKIEYPCINTEFTTVIDGSELKVLKSPVWGADSSHARVMERMGISWLAWNICDNQTNIDGNFKTTLKWLSDSSYSLDTTSLYTPYRHVYKFIINR